MQKTAPWGHALPAPTPPCRMRDQTSRRAARGGSTGAAATRGNSLDLAGRLHFADPSGPADRGLTQELRQRRRKLRNGGRRYLIAAKIRL